MPCYLATAQLKGAQPPKVAKKAPEAIHLLYMGTSANAYRGDLNSGYHKWTSSVHLGFKLNHKTRLNGNLNFSVGNVSGQNPHFSPDLSEISDHVEPNRFFNTSVITANYDLHFNLIKKPNFIIYLSQGLGVIRFNPKDESGNPFQKQPFTRPRGEVYGNTAIMLPSNAGFIYFFPNRFAAGIQAGFNNPLTDYLDNISYLGSKEGNDNILMVRFSFFVPLTIIQPKEFDR